jgi:NAD(P)H dehydrogenase (quinone)
MADVTDLPRLAVTGATGHVGGAVAQALAERGIEQRLLVRSPDRAPQLDGTVVRGAAYGDPDAAKKALPGVDTLFMVSAAESADRLDQHFAFVDAAAAAGVRQVVYTSFVNAAPDAIFTLVRHHYATERRIVDSGMAYTFLRDNFYLDLMELFAGEQGVIAGPAGDGRVGMVARADVARSATAVLLDPEAHAGTTYTLTGPESLTLAEAAERLTAARGRPFRFHNETLEEAYASRASYSAPDWQVEAWVTTYTAIAAGQLDVVTDDVERLTGRRPASLAEHLAGGPDR